MKKDQQNTPHKHSEDECSHEQGFVRNKCLTSLFICKTCGILIDRTEYAYLATPQATQSAEIMHIMTKPKQNEVLEVKETGEEFLRLSKIFNEMLVKEEVPEWKAGLCCGRFAITAMQEIKLARKKSKEETIAEILKLPTHPNGYAQSRVIKVSDIKSLLGEE